MGLVKIDKDVPLPSENAGLGRLRERKYQWEAMEIGDSFVFPAEISVKSARSIASRRASTDGRKYLVRRNDENGEVRCWRRA